MASSSTFAVILVFVALGGVLSAEAAGRPSGTLQRGWNGDSIHDTDTSTGTGSLQRLTIPTNQDSLLRASPLDADRTAKYLTQINDNTLGFHSAEFCQEAQLQCSANMAIVDPTLRISKSRLVDQELLQRTRDLVDATRAMQFDRKDIVKDREIELPLSRLQDSYPAVSFLPQALAEKMPFTSANLPELLEKLSIPQDSNLAIMMSRTVGQCEAQEQGKEIRKCVTSLEGMKTFVSSSLPQDKRIVALQRSSSIPGAGESRGTDKAKASSSWKVLDTKQYDRAVVCRNSVFPFAVFECHDTSNTSGMRIFQVEMQSRSDGSRISEVAACHENAVHAAGTMATENSSNNNSNNPEPAQACHWITDSLIWAPAN
jgi:hypothetical protein